MTLWKVWYPVLWPGKNGLNTRSGQTFFSESQVEFFLPCVLQLNVTIMVASIASGKTILFQTLINSLPSESIFVFRADLDRDFWSWVFQVYGRHERSIRGQMQNERRSPGLYPQILHFMGWNLFGGCYNHCVGSEMALKKPEWHHRHQVTLQKLLFGFTPGNCNYLVAIIFKIISIVETIEKFCPRLVFLLSIFPLLFQSSINIVDAKNTFFLKPS